MCASGVKDGAFMITGFSVVCKKMKYLDKM